MRCIYEDPSSQVLKYRAGILEETSRHFAERSHLDRIRLRASKSAERCSVVFFETKPFDSVDEAMQSLLLMTMRMVDEKFTEGYQPGEPAG